MASGAGVAGLAGGFGKALSAILIGNRQEQQRKAERQQDVEFRNFQSTLPIVFQNFQQNPTPEGAAALEDMLVKINPELKKSIKRSGFSFETLGPLLSQMEPAQPAYTEAIPEVPGATRQVPATPAQPTLQATSGAMTQMPDPTVRLFGAPVQSPEQRTAAMGEAEIQGKVQAARRLLSTGAAKTMAEALDRVGLRQTTTGASTAMRFGGVVSGAEILAENPNAKTSQGVAVNSTQYYRRQIQPDGSEVFFSTVPPGGASGGEYLTRAAIKMGFRSPAEVPADRRDELFKEASAIETEESRAARLGTGQGALDSPITPDQAKDLPGATIGTPGSAYTGQQPATVQQAERRRNAEAIKAQIPKIATAVDAALPSENEIAGLAPNLSNALRQRFFKERRNQYAQLEAEINNIRSLLVRTLQQNVGTETELDAQRALSTLAQFQGSLWDPAGGDTRESAKIRLTSTLAFIDRILEEAPRPLTTPATAGATGARTGAPELGKPFQDEKGNWQIPRPGETAPR